MLFGVLDFSKCAEEWISANRKNHKLLDKYLKSTIITCKAGLGHFGRGVHYWSVRQNWFYLLENAFAKMKLS
jgi:hypothetical protein